MIEEDTALENAYELERANKIAQNAERLKQFGVHESKKNLLSHVAQNGVYLVATTVPGDLPVVRKSKRASAAAARSRWQSSDLTTVNCEEEQEDKAEDDADVEEAEEESVSIQSEDEATEASSSEEEDIAPQHIVSSARRGAEALHELCPPKCQKEPSSRGWGGKRRVLAGPFEVETVSKIVSLNEPKRKRVRSCSGTQDHPSATSSALAAGPSGCSLVDRCLRSDESAAAAGPSGCSLVDRCLRSDESAAAAGPSGCSLVDRCLRSDESAAAAGPSGCSLVDRCLRSDESAAAAGPSASCVVPREVQKKVTAVPQISRAAKGTKKSSRSASGAAKELGSNKSAAGPPTEQQVTAMFQMFGPNTSGLITESCIRQQAKRLCIVLEDETIAAMMEWLVEKVPGSRKGAISCANFKELCTQVWNTS
ncbi:hypothetical protein CEUSTIGMA_g3670.t1 [Chlamydomonas eustigma]|uniref:EF-hand domain-containing protein n=1 Tax=Chlamydomonas eustigma TaxID=1157962 RepID=A0A250WZL9_9CHLO|nr:hypothetical protein CEUSTIGMA_g3670.t1 [Chlamydomonas eustigma]|eukprot:GAX76226.1 hypothetical protein CEUSTIGMA_g3670.t1 [Chlamydomonas eustigma]